GITGRAAVAATEDLALVQQGIDHQLAGLLDRWAEHVHGTGFGFDAVGKQLSDTVLHVHRKGSLASESFPEPAVGCRIRGVADGGDDIETTGLVGQMGVGQQIVVGSGNHAFLLAPVYGFRGVAPQVSPPVAHFDEFYSIGIAQVLIKLTLLATVVAGQQAHSGTEQQLFGEPLGLVAADLAQGPATAYLGARSPTGYSCPSTIWPHDSSLR